ncbi:hypothetical protein IAD21_02751 [Abditibacteriota bacterium]|nr:hypothetical protein IAD21_02751 [Abditibacteriota bacterium]
MGIFDSFRKHPKKSSAAFVPELDQQTVPVSAPNLDKSTPEPVDVALLQVLFQATLSEDVAHLQKVVRAFDSTLSSAIISDVTHMGSSDESDASRSYSWQLTWGVHRVEVISFNSPMPESIVEECLALASYGDDDKNRARNHKASVIMVYREGTRNITEQFDALALVAGALCGEGGIAVLNSNARTSLPAKMFTATNGGSPSQFLPALIAQLTHSN